MKVTPRIEMLEGIIGNGFNGANTKINRVRYWHNEISAVDYSEAIKSVINSLSTTIDYLKELQKEIKK